jgi:hypothetical protein
MLTPAQKIKNARSRLYSEQVRINQLAASITQAATDASQALLYNADTGQKSITGNNTFGDISTSVNIDVSEMTVGSVFHLTVGMGGNMGSVPSDLWFSIFALGNTATIAIAKIPQTVAPANQQVDVTADFWFTIRNSTQGDFVTRVVAQQDSSSGLGAVGVGFTANAAIVTTATSGVIARAAINGISSGASLTSKFSTLDRYVALWLSIVMFARSGLAP